MRQVASSHIWQHINTAPSGRCIDVFFVNGSFEIPATGILLDAELKGTFWVSNKTGGQVPEIYVILWRENRNGVVYNHCYNEYEEEKKTIN